MLNRVLIVCGVVIIRHYVAFMTAFVIGYQFEFYVKLYLIRTHTKFISSRHPCYSHYSECM